jgi:sugar lactone lactonase YvrE
MRPIFAWFSLAVLLTLPGLAFTADAGDLPAPGEVTPELYATGFEFAEGPALDAPGNLYVVNYRGNGNIGRITPEGTASVFCDLRQLLPDEGQEPRANGLKVDTQGRLIAADAGVGRLLRISADGSNVEVLADRCDGKHFHLINDVALDLAGNIYCTDPGGSSVENPIGSVYRYDIKTSRVSQLDTGLASPNGIGVTPDQKRLCVSDSLARCIWIYDLTREGAVANRRVLIDFPKVEGIRGTEFIPDGLVFDAAGRLYVGMWTDGVINVVCTASGKLIRQYDAGGSQATNCHFHGGYLYTTVAAKEAVFRLKLGVEGFDYNGSAKGR